MMTLFDIGASPSSEANAAPMVRTSDPVSSHEAAARVTPARRALIAEIRVAVGFSWDLYEQPLTAFDIAEWVEMRNPKRWDEGTIRTAIKGAGLRCVDIEGVSPRGQKCSRYSL